MALDHHDTVPEFDDEANEPPPAPPEVPAFVLPKVANYAAAVTIRQTWDDAGYRVRRWRSDWWVYEAGVWSRTDDDSRPPALRDHRDRGRLQR